MNAYTFKKRVFEVTLKYSLGRKSNQSKQSSPVQILQNMASDQGLPSVPLGHLVLA